MVSPNHEMWQSIRRFLVLLIVAAPFLFLFVTLSRASPQRTVAEFCVTIDAHGESNQDLVSRFDGLAAAQSLEADTSNPAARRYQTAPKDAEVVISFGLGRFGAVVTFYRFEQDAGEALLEALRSFVRKEIAASYRVTACEDIEGFSMPYTLR